MSNKAQKLSQGKSALKQANSTSSSGEHSTNVVSEPVGGLKMGAKPREFKLSGELRFVTFSGLNLWRQRQDHCRWIRSFIEQDQERTFLVTLPFRRYEPLIHARETSRRMVRRWEAVVDGWVRILERGGRGVHLHIVVHVLVQLQARTEILAVSAVIKRYQSKERIGNWSVEPVRDAQLTSEYLTKQFRPGNTRYRVKSKSITYSASIQRQPWWLAKQEVVP
jgi:hypothetical protein